MGFVRPSSLRSTAAAELNGSPVALTPSFARASSGRPECVAHHSENERLRDAHHRELDARVARFVDVAARAGDAHAEEVRLRGGERRVDVGTLAIAVPPKAFVCFLDKSLHALVGRQRPGRDEGVVHQKRQKTGTSPTATTP